jgi:hypothetical protein
MHARVVGALLCLCSFVLLTGAVRPANAANAQDLELSAEEMEAAQAVRAERIPQAAALLAKEIERRAVRSVEKKVVDADALRLAKSLSDAQLEALVEGRDPVEVFRDPQLAAAPGKLSPVTAAAVGDPGSDLLFVPLPPCRVIDTRFGGGKMVPAQQRDFKVAGTTGFEAQGGNAGGCGVPVGATDPLAAAVVINFIAVEPAGEGHMTAWEFGQPEPFASIINYANVGLNIANGVIIPIAGVSSVAKDLSIIAAVSGVHVVADVTGYFTRFPVEQFQGGLKSQVVTATNTTLVDLASGGCQELLSCAVTAPAAGTVVVEAWSQIVVSHTAGTTDRFVMQLETAAAVSCPADHSVDASQYEVPGALGTNADVDFTLSHGKSFPITAGATLTFRLSGKMVTGASNLDKVENSRLLCTFIPN